MTTTGNQGLDALADAIAARVTERLQQGHQRMLRIREAAVYIGVSRRTLDQYIADHVLPVVREGGIIRVDRRDLDNWIEMRKGPK